MRVSEQVMRVLSAARMDGNFLYLEGTLDRPLYMATNKVLEAAGGVWNRKAKAHLFETQAEDAMDQILLTGEVTTHQDFGYFPTPPEVVDTLIERAYLSADRSDWVLEPSAGSGAIALAIRPLVDKVKCVELQPPLADKLAAEGLDVECRDFLAIAPARNFDRVIMNPPFARQSDIEHVRHASQFLKHGGRLSAVMSAGVTFREDRRTDNFRMFLSERDAKVEPLPPGSFKSSRTLVNTILVSFVEPSNAVGPPIFSR